MPEVNPDYDSGHAHGWKLYFDDRLVAELIFQKWEDIRRYYFKVDIREPGFDFEQLNTYDLAPRFRCVNRQLDMTYDFTENGCCFGGPDGQVMLRDMRELPMFETAWDRWKTAVGVIAILLVIAGDLALSFSESPFGTVYRAFWVLVIASSLFARLLRALKDKS